MDWIHGVHGRLQPLDVRQIREMQAAVDFGSPTYAHPNMTTLTEKECLQDFRASKELLEEVLGQEVRYLAYPRACTTNTFARPPG